MSIEIQHIGCLLEGPNMDFEGETTSNKTKGAKFHYN